MTGAARIALTFDDGPATWTEPILETLRAHGARATFFVIGSVAQQQPDLIRRIASDGHEVGNHTWSHPALARTCDDRRVREELERTNAALTAILGSPPTRFRAPYYDVDERVERVAATLGLAHTRGDIRPPDWHPGAKAALIAAMVVKQIGAGCVVGLHDGYPPGHEDEGRTRRPTVDAVAAIVPALVQRGFDLVTASELLAGRMK